MLLFSQIVTWLYDRFLFPCELTDAPDRATLKRTLNISKFTKFNIKHNLKVIFVSLKINLMIVLIVDFNLNSLNYFI